LLWGVVDDVRKKGYQRHSPVYLWCTSCSQGDFTPLIDIGIGSDEKKRGGALKRGREQQKPNAVRALFQSGKKEVGGGNTEIS